ncbi:MAG: 50S ribosomal protein L11 methyltransferase [Actinomycetota bacterium]
MPRAQVEEATARMLALFPEGFVEQAVGDDVELSAFTDEAGAGRLRASFGAVASEPVAPGWEEEWKRFHVPAVVGSLWIGPPWEQPPPELTAVVIDPGRAFGTGAHATTRMCLELLSGLDPGGVLDAGCGSGVLAIAAAKLGFGPVFAIDTDPAAIDVTERNAEANGVELEAIHADVQSDSLPSADIVVANLDLPTLAGITRSFHCRQAITSGYGVGDHPELTGLRPTTRLTRGNWAADLFASQ